MNRVDTTLLNTPQALVALPRRLALHASDPHFSRQAEAYEALDRRIYEVEDGRQAMDDLALQVLKNERVALKDQIAERLRKAGG